MDIYEIVKHLPHRYPFLMIDRVVECSKGDSLVALKNVTINEPFFQGHFPQRAVMPGVMILEALAQATGILAFKTGEQRPENLLYYFVGIDKARFKRVVIPGDQLRLEVSLKRVVRGMWMFSGTATVDGEVACTAELMCTAREVES
jgi:3-hydroxyacyl-[acyl-carrier-protein] dehydratase